MSIPMYEPLYVAPPITEQHVCMAWLLQARQAARQGLVERLRTGRHAVAQRRGVRRVRRRARCVQRRPDSGLTRWAGPSPRQ